MAYSYETVRLDKGMYGEAGHSFTQVLEKCDPSEQYRGTPLEHLDAFQRQLKRFDIKVKGAGSDVVAKFFATWESAVLFPEYVARAVHQGMEENDILPQMIATETRISGLDYRSLASTPTEEEKQLNLVAEGAAIPETRVHTQENLVQLHKRGRMLVASYEAIQFQRLDLFSVTLRQIGAYISRMQVADAIDVLQNGDGNENAAPVYTVGTDPIAGTAGTLTYEALVEPVFPLRHEHPGGGECHGPDPEAPGDAGRHGGADLPGHRAAGDPHGGHPAPQQRGAQWDHSGAGPELRPGDGAGQRRAGGVRQAHRPAAGAGGGDLHCRVCQDLYPGGQGTADRHRPRRAGGALMAGREDVLDLALAFAGRALTEGEEGVLSLLCETAWDRWAGQLRDGVTVEDCGQVMAVAAAWTALSAMAGALEQSQPVPVSFTAGDLRVDRGSGGMDACARSLGRQAEALMAPFVRDEAFAFWEVEG